MALPLVSLVFCAGFSSESAASRSGHPHPSPYNDQIVFRRLSFNLKFVVPPPIPGERPATWSEWTLATIGLFTKLIVNLTLTTQTWVSGTQIAAPAWTLHLQSRTTRKGPRGA